MQLSFWPKFDHDTARARFFLLLPHDRASYGLIFVAGNIWPPLWGPGYVEKSDTLLNQAEDSVLRRPCFPPPTLLSYF